MKRNEENIAETLTGICVTFVTHLMLFSKYKKKTKVYSKEGKVMKKMMIAVTAFLLVMIVTGFVPTMVRAGHVSVQFPVLLDGKGCASFDQAVQEAKDGSVIELKADVTLSHRLVIRQKNIEIIGNGHVLNMIDDGVLIVNDKSGFRISNLEIHKDVSNQNEHVLIIE